MGYAVYLAEGRWAGYGVPATCDQPGCGATIDRGMAYCCGGEPGADKGCGLYFCSDHLWISATDDDPQMCERCCDGEPPFGPTPDTTEWVAHMLTDESWQQWRAENPQQVTALSSPPARCCDLHGRNCEPIEELCCSECTEVAHPQHRDGSVCSNPDLSFPPGQTAGDA